VTPEIVWVWKICTLSDANIHRKLTLGKNCPSEVTTPTEIRRPEFNALLCEGRFQIPGSSMILPTVAPRAVPRRRSTYQWTSLATLTEGRIRCGGRKKRGAPEPPKNFGRLSIFLLTNARAVCIFIPTTMLASRKSISFIHSPALEQLAGLQAVAVAGGLWPALEGRRPRHRPAGGPQRAF
jgi:hypothetical protein